METVNVMMECVEGQEPKPVLVMPNPPKDLFKGLTTNEEKVEALDKWSESITESDYMMLKINDDGSSTLVPQVYEGSCVTVTRKIA